MNISCNNYLLQGGPISPAHFRRIFQYRRKNLRNLIIFGLNTSSANIAESPKVAENAQYRRNFLRFIPERIIPEREDLY
jgi:hypothetical protein